MSTRPSVGKDSMLPLIITEACRAISRYVLGFTETGRYLYEVHRQEGGQT